MSRKAITHCSLASLLLLLITATMAPAAAVVAVACLPPPDGAYSGDVEITYTFADGTMVTITRAKHFGFGDCEPPPEPAAPPKMHMFTSIVWGAFSVNGGSEQRFDVPVDVTVIDTFVTEQQNVRFYSTEMTQLDLSGADPGGTGLPPNVRIREDPNRISIGEVRIEDSTGLGFNNAGPYTITSFFDIFTEMSLDGGAMWMPGVGQNGDGSSRVDLQECSQVGCSSVPEPSTILLFATGLIGLGGMLLRRRRRGA